MSDKSKLKKLAAAKRKLKEYHQQRGRSNEDEKNCNQIDVKNEVELSEKQVDELLWHGTSEDNCDDQQKNVYHDNIISTNTVEILVAEKSSLTKQITKLQTCIKEKDLEIEELNTRLECAQKRIDEIESCLLSDKKELSCLKSELEHWRNKKIAVESELENSKTTLLEQETFVGELKNEIQRFHEKVGQLEHNLKEKDCELDLVKIRLSQVSDEGSIAADNRVEALTQTNFLFEQQIRDLQAMVEQLRTEKEQANQQYQNYVQHLSKEITSLTEKNLALSQENSKLIDRENELISHVSDLEKQIQLHISKQEVLANKLSGQNINTKEQNEIEHNLSHLKHDLLELENELRVEKRNSYELKLLINEKDGLIAELEEKIGNILAERPDNSKVLAVMESDKIAASRAIIQNEDLKNQLFEIQTKLVQVTNEKCEIMDLLYTEQHSKKELLAKVSKTDGECQNLNDRLHFKDEEMIRLTHENNELNKQILQLNLQIDRLKHYEAKEYLQNYCKDNKDEKQPNNVPVLSDHINTDEDTSIMDDSKCHENVFIKDPENNESALPTEEAMQKLQKRFKTLMNEVADLTDEKQRLEHLVLQLQGETETIGEYIALYQTQRRILKQREIEKNSHLQKLLNEREEMRLKIMELTKLISSLGISATAANDKNSLQSIEMNGHNLPSNVISKISNIIAEIEQNGDNKNSILMSVDHCACCSGKFETV